MLILSCSYFHAISIQEIVYKLCNMSYMLWQVDNIYSMVQAKIHTFPLKYKRTEAMMHSPSASTIHTYSQLMTQHQGQFWGSVFAQGHVGLTGLGSNHQPSDP